MLVAFIGRSAVAQETIETRIGDLSFTHDFANGYPTDETVRMLFNEMDFQRACQAYIDFREVLARNDMTERTLASYAPIDGALFIRTAAGLYRIERGER